MLFTFIFRGENPMPDTTTPTSPVAALTSLSPVQSFATALVTLIEGVINNHKSANGNTGVEIADDLIIILQTFQSQIGQFKLIGADIKANPLLAVEALVGAAFQIAKDITAKTA